MSFDVAIIGGGIIGLMTAYELIDTGLKVVVIDKGELGQEASSAGGGILSALPPWKQSQISLQLQLWSQKRYPVLCDELLDKTGIDCDYLASGMLVIEPELDDDFDSWQKQKIENSVIVDNLSRFPKLHHLQTNKKSVWLPQAAHINNIYLINALKKSLQKKSVTFIENSQVLEVKTKANAVTKLITSKKEIVADNVVIAAGAWSGDAQFNFGIHVKPIKGQMISYSLDKELIDCIVLANGKYCIPRKNGQLVIGSTLEDTGYNKATTNEAKEQLQSFAEIFIPELKAHQPSAHWTGLRPRSEQPIIAKHNQVNNLYINTGHYRNGILQAPASARLIKNLLHKEHPEINFP